MHIFTGVKLVLKTKKKSPETVEKISCATAAPLGRNRRPEGRTTVPEISNGRAAMVGFIKGVRRQR